MLGTTPREIAARRQVAHGAAVEAR
jgi:hypothetical protein